MSGSFFYQKAIWRSTVLFKQLSPSRTHLFRPMSSAAADDVLFEDNSSKKVIVLNRPKALNSLNFSMVKKIHPQLQAWVKDPSTSMVIIKGAGEKAFCAGGDVKAVTEAGQRGDPLFTNFFRNEYTLNNAIGSCPIPYIALINGITMGGGVGLSVHGQYRIASEKTVVAMPETAIGLFPDVGGTHFMSRLQGALGEFLSLTGHRLKGLDVQKAGIATHFVSHSLISDLENELLSMESPTPENIASLIDGYHAKCATADEFSLSPYLEGINRDYSASTMEAIFSNLEKDGSEFSLKNLGLMKKMSPSSMKITLEALRRGRSMTLKECLLMELRMTEGVRNASDFFEGVRAVLVDKDHSPQWQPASLEGVTKEMVDSYFTRVPQGGDLEL